MEDTPLTPPASRPASSKTPARSVPWYKHGPYLLRLVRRFADTLTQADQDSPEVDAMLLASRALYTTDPAATRAAIWTPIETRAKSAEQLTLADRILEIVSVQ